MLRIQTALDFFERDMALPSATNTRQIFEFIMVRVVGLEPTLQRNWILNPARLPIPPHPHSARISSWDEMQRSAGTASRPGLLISQWEM